MSRPEKQFPMNMNVEKVAKILGIIDECNYFLVRENCEQADVVD